jgi:hypothetical protein
MVALLLCCAAALPGQPALKSGPQPGDSLAAFKVEAITGPKAGQQLCYV